MSWFIRDQPEIQACVLVLGYSNTDSGVFGKAGFDTGTLTVRENWNQAVRLQILTLQPWFRSASARFLFCFINVSSFL